MTTTTSKKCETCESAALITGRRMKTGDTVRHIPTGQEWVVAFVHDDRLVACGWPLSYEPVSNFELTRECSMDERVELLEELAAMHGDDPRRYYAIRELGGEGWSM